jgi:hypothetical protein
LENDLFEDKFETDICKHERCMELAQNFVLMDSDVSGAIEASGYIAEI